MLSDPHRPRRRRSSRPRFEAPRSTPARKRDCASDRAILATQDSDKGCKMAATEHPDVILMDLEMPDDDRWEPVRRLKNDPQTRDIPIIGMSAHAVESEREKAIATGCEEFDAKPIEFESLVAAIRRVVANPK
jgi:CheY-like chemotaxis protein